MKRALSAVAIVLLFNALAPAQDSPPVNPYRGSSVLLWVFSRLYT